MSKRAGYVHHTRDDGLQTVYRTFNRKAADLLVRRLDDAKRISARDVTALLAKAEGNVLYRDVLHGDPLLERANCDD